MCLNKIKCKIFALVIGLFVFKNYVVIKMNILTIVFIYFLFDGREVFETISMSSAEVDRLLT